MQCIFTKQISNITYISINKQARLRLSRRYQWHATTCS